MQHPLGGKGALVSSALTMAVGLAAVALGCGSDGAAPDASFDAGALFDGAPLDARTTDSSTKGDAADGSTGCAAGQTTCAGACVDTQSNPANCGRCTKTCDVGLTCAAGECHAPLQTVWEKHFGSPDLGNNIDSVALDALGNVYLAGYFSGSADLGGGALTSAGASDVLVASLSPTGVHRWSKRFGGAGADQGAGIAVSAGGKVYVTGNFRDTAEFGGVPLVSAGADDAFLLVLDAATGAFGSARRFGGNGGDTGLGLGVDSSGNVTVGGFFYSPNGALDFGGGSTTGVAGVNAFVASFDAGGQYRWSRAMGGPGSSCQDLTVDPNGNVAAVGEFQGTTDFGAGSVTSAGDFDAFVASYTSSGVPRFSHRFGASQADEAQSVSTDAAGNVLVGGSFGGSFHASVNFGVGAPLVNIGASDGFVVRFDASGTANLVRQLSPVSASGNIVVRGVGFDGTGNIVAAGHLEGAANLGTGALAPLGTVDMFVAGFTPAGATRYARRLGGTGLDQAFGLAVASGGAMVVSGYFSNTADVGKGPIAGAVKNGVVLLIAPP